MKKTRMVLDKAIDLSPVEAIKAFFNKTTLGKFNLTLQIFKMCECNIISNNKLTMTFERLVYISNHSDKGVANIKLRFKQISKYICIKI